jgi:two-component system response regulator CpxR
MRPKKTILCVDDNEQILSVRTFLLETRGYRVLAAQSSYAALELAAAAAPGAIDVAVVDLLMPQMDGNELIRQLKGMHPGLPALLVSGTVTGHERSTAADVFLPKGASTPMELLERVRILATRRRGPKKVVKPVIELEVAAAGSSAAGADVPSNLQQTPAPQPSALTLQQSVHTPISSPQSLTELLLQQRRAVA